MNDELIEQMKLKNILLYNIYCILLSENLMKNPNAEEHKGEISEAIQELQDTVERLCGDVMNG